MAQVIVTDIELNGLSVTGLNVLKAALRHARNNTSVKCHELPLNDFCALAGIPRVSATVMRRLLGEAQRVLGCVEVVDTAARTRTDLPCGSSPMFSFVGGDDSSVAFEVLDFVLQDSVMNKVLALSLPCN
ncbi:hypothetical protein [Janthinobacterium sp.]|uniref:hypothetical protein n=1 Tax=Janthinobacterium sp. TaxID=1871054 RepID=UPI002626C0DF|nr:hypothetical protein [Janthinobacterium sp.]